MSLSRPEGLLQGLVRAANAYNAGTGTIKALAAAQDAFNAAAEDIARPRRYAIKDSLENPAFHIVQGIQGVVNTLKGGKEGFRGDFVVSPAPYQRLPVLG